MRPKYYIGNPYMCIDQNTILSCKNFFVYFDFFDGIMFKIERASKYRKMNCFSKIFNRIF